MTRPETIHDFCHDAGGPISETIVYYSPSAGRFQHEVLGHNSHLPSMRLFETRIDALSRPLKQYLGCKDMLCSLSRMYKLPSGTFLVFIFLPPLAELLTRPDTRFFDITTQPHSLHLEITPFHRRSACHRGDHTTID